MQNSLNFQETKKKQKDDIMQFLGQTDDLMGDE